MLLNPTSHVAATEASTCASAGEVGPDKVPPSHWSNLVTEYSDMFKPPACQWNVQSTTRLSLNLVLHHHTTTNIASQQLSLPKYGGPIELPTRLRQHLASYTGLSQLSVSAIIFTCLSGPHLNT